MKAKNKMAKQSKIIQINTDCITKMHEKFSYIHCNVNISKDRIVCIA